MSDLIRRQDAIEAVETKIKKWNAVDGEGYHVGLGLRYTDVIDTLTELPSAEKAQLSREGATSDLINRKGAIDAVNFGITIAKAINKETGDVIELFVKENEALRKAIKRIKDLPSAEPEPKPISYMECANAMLKMWIDNVLTDGEYNRIMEKINSKYIVERRDE